MSKIYQEIEKIMKFRIYSNAEIASYMARMSRMGKIDDVKRHAILTLILVRLGELEDQEIEKPILTYASTSTSTTIADYVISQTPEDAAPNEGTELDRQAKIKEQRAENMAKARAARAAKKAAKVL